MLNCVTQPTRLYQYVFSGPTGLRVIMVRCITVTDVPSSTYYVR
jgi:hypothetical protein